ncbi:MAG: YkgJ family cysteine cluster protein [Desulfobacteraceae bacterium]|nr:MAG: YkgJ family cysteine cluster protein [Desulfobacteraceae bacterium]
MTNETQRTHCIRCGECCLGSSPSLHTEDLPLLDTGVIPRHSLFTIREGETVWDNIERRVAVAAREMIKIRERSGGGGCIFYEEAAKVCSIYLHRPAQCRALKCWDTSDFRKVHSTPKLERSHLLSGGALSLIAAHEKRCGYARLKDLVECIRRDGEEPVQEILNMLKFDFRLRPLASERLGIDGLEMDFLFGRPLIRTIESYGLTVVRADGSFLLTTAPQEKRG